jgi:hypothetical protein
MPKPASANIPALSLCWEEASPLLREFTANAARPCQPVMEALAPFCGQAQTTTSTM